MKYYTALGLAVDLDQEITKKIISKGKKLDYVRELNPQWTKEQINEEIAKLTGEIAALTSILTLIDNIDTNGC